MDASPSPRISLCMIVCNEEPVIKRLLDSALGWVDEICMVRAAGQIAPDRTIEIARDWCAGHDVAFRTEDYINPTEPNWPHVESFGAARQQAVNLATGDWCMWLDADDVLEGEAKEFRALVAKTESDWISLVYDVRNMQRAFPRERLWRRGKARWGRPVHEQLSPTEPSCRIMFYVGPHHPRVVHAPIDTRARSRDRNLRILDKSILEGTPSYFYRGWDLLLDGKPDKAAADFQRCLAVDDDPQRRLASFLHLAQIGGKEDGIDAAWEAARIAPGRREGWGLLALLLMQSGKAQEALVLIRNAMLLPPPAHPDWVHNPEWHAGKLEDMESSCLRILGQTEAARHLERKRFLEAGEVFSVLLPFEDAKSISIRETWLGLAENRRAVEVILYGKPSPIMRPYLHAVGIVMPPVHLTRGRVVVFADGQPPGPGWDREAFDKLRGALDKGEAGEGDVCGRRAVTREALGRLLTLEGPVIPLEPKSVQVETIEQRPWLHNGMQLLGSAGERDLLPLVLWNAVESSNPARAREYAQARESLDSLIHADQAKGRRFTGRPAICEMLTHASKHGPTILSNADIDLTDVVRAVREYAPKSSANDVWALSRDDLNRADSQDVWVFFGPVKAYLLGDYQLGKPGVDNRLAADLVRAGYCVRNPCKSIAAFHIHASQHRTYTARDVVPGPYALVPPCTLEEAAGVDFRPFYADLRGPQPVDAAGVSGGPWVRVDSRTEPV